MSKKDKDMDQKLADLGERLETAERELEIARLYPEMVRLAKDYRKHPTNTNESEKVNLRCDITEIVQWLRGLDLYQTSTSLFAHFAPDAVDFSIVTGGLVTDTEEHFVMSLKSGGGTLQIDFGFLMVYRLLEALKHAKEAWADEGVDR